MAPVDVRIHDLWDGFVRFPFHGWIGAVYPALNPGINSFQFFRGLIRFEYSVVDRGINSF